MTSVALPPQQTANFSSGGDAELPGLPRSATPPGLLSVTPAQRGYLDDLASAGVHPTSELRALSIGSYVCQARAAGRNDLAVWDYVGPMVRSDVADARAAAPQAAAVPSADVTIASYIRIATLRLC